MTMHVAFISKYSFNELVLITQGHLLCFVLADMRTLNHVRPCSLYQQVFTTVSMNRNRNRCLI